MHLDMGAFELFTIDIHTYMYMYVIRLNNPVNYQYLINITLNVLRI